MRLTNLTALFHILILPFIFFFLSQRTFLAAILALILLLLSILIDLIDRAFIRKKNQIHSFLHPFSDKLVVLVLLFSFTLRGDFPSLVLSIFILRDLIVGIIRMRASRDYVNLPAVSFYGKIITSFQFTLVLLLIIENALGYLQSSIFALIDILAFFLTSLIIVLAVISIFHNSLAYGQGLHNRKQYGKEVKEEQLFILANKKSGGYKNLYRRRLLRRFARRRGAKIHYLSAAQNWLEGVREIIKNINHIIIAGGDGTFESVLNNKDFYRKSIGFFPLGAGNSYYSYFYKGKRFEYLRSRFHFREMPLDVLELQWEGGKVLTGFLSIGIDAEVIRHATRRKNHKFSDYWFAGTTTAFGPQINYSLECFVDGRRYSWDNCFNLIVGKIPYIGYGLRSLLGHIEPDDGLMLGMASVNTHSPFFNKALRLWQILITQLGFAASPLIPLKGKVFHIKSIKPFPLQVGGEFLGHSTWIRVKVKRKQKVLMI